MNKFALFVLTFCLLISGFVLYENYNQSKTQKIEDRPILKVPPIINVPKIPQISVKIPGHLLYPQIIAQLDKWQNEAIDLVDRGTYGQSTRNQPLNYIKITNKVNINIKQRKVVLITACIHGNEPLATSTIMAVIGNMLADYGKDKDVTNLVDNREIYFIPVVSPDSFPNSRHVDGIDPNRNFPTQKNPTIKSVAPIQAIREFVLKIKPSAVISGHTWGRVYLTPFGDSMVNCPDDASYKQIVGKMAQMSGYRIMRACDMYGIGGINNPPPKDVSLIPIYGSEVDWYYRQGAFAIVMEMGLHQRLPSMEDTRVEFEMVYKSVLHFINEAPIIELKRDK